MKNNFNSFFQGELSISVQGGQHWFQRGLHQATLPYIQHFRNGRLPHVIKLKRKKKNIIRIISPDPFGSSCLSLKKILVIIYD